MDGETSPPTKRARHDPPTSPGDGDATKVEETRNFGPNDGVHEEMDVPAPSKSTRVHWRLPDTKQTGGVWQIIDGFATPEECRALVADAKQGLAESLREPLRRFADPPLLGVVYRSADATALASKALSALSAKAADVTNVGINEAKDSVMVAHTSARVASPENERAEGEAEGAVGGDDGKEGDAAREDSVDSEGFLLREDRAKDGDASRWARLVNCHHDHNRDDLRACTVFVYLSDVERVALGDTDGDASSAPSPGGEKFFPCVTGDTDPREGDELRARLALHGKRGTHLVFHDNFGDDDSDDSSEDLPIAAEFGHLAREGAVEEGSVEEGGVEDGGVEEGTVEDEGVEDGGVEGLRAMGGVDGMAVPEGGTGDNEGMKLTMAECEARYAAVRHHGRHPTRGECPESMRGTVFEGDGVPGLLIRPKEGRAVVFWHGDDAGTSPEAWHAPACVEEGSSDKWLVTFFKVPVGAERKAKPVEEAIVPGGFHSLPNRGSISIAAADPFASISAAASGGAAHEVNIGGVMLDAATRGNEDAATTSSMMKLGLMSASTSYPAAATAAGHTLQAGGNAYAYSHDLGSLVSATTAPGNPAAFGHTSAGLVYKPNKRGQNIDKQKWCCLVDNCMIPRKQPVDQGARLPLTCPHHQGALVVVYEGVASR